MTESIDTAMLPRQSRRRRHSRLLWWCVLASIGLHALLIAGLPPVLVSEFAPLPVQVLDVVLVRPEPPAAPPLVRNREPPRPPSSATPRARRGEPPVSQAKAGAPAPAPPEPRTAPSTPAVSPNAVAHASPEPKASVPAARASAPAPAAAAGDAPAPDAAAPAPVSPPRFNAAYLRNPAPRYPLVARRRGEEGTVTLRVHVRRDGVPASVNLEKSSGSAALDDAALEAVRAWRFAPARQGGSAVEAWVLVPIVFRLEGAS